MMSFWLAGEVMDLKQKVVIITGAGSGIGLEIVRQFLAANGRIVAVDRDAALPKTLESLATEHPGRLHCVIGDVAQEQTAQNYADLAMKSYGRIDVMINNAAIAFTKTIDEHSPHEWDAVMNTDLKSIYWSARAVIPQMKQGGGGLMLNTGSISSVVGISRQAAYAAAKGAVAQLTRQMAVDYASFRIRVNAICPGTVDTPLVRKAAQDSGDPEAFMQSLKDGHLVGRIASPAEIAAFFLYMASDDATFFTGAILMMDGGYTAR